MHACIYRCRYPSKHLCMRVRVRYVYILLFTVHAVPNTSIPVVQTYKLLSIAHEHTHRESPRGQAHITWPPQPCRIFRGRCVCARRAFLMQLRALAAARVDGLMDFRRLVVEHGNVLLLTSQRHTVHHHSYPVFTRHLHAY